VPALAGLVPCNNICVRENLLLHAQDFEPAYLKCHQTGELEQRARSAVAKLASCRNCPRACDADRAAGKTGTCQIGRYARVSSYFPHFGEEDCLRGWNGSGTIFFAQCNLRCVFCQNYDISQSGIFPETSPERLAGMMLELQARGCHNINLVTPTHVVPQILEALPLAIEAGLRLPLVYNTSGYDALEPLRLLDGIVDIYMPDFKIWEPEAAATYLNASDYPEVARAALREMHRQVGDLRLDEDGLAMRGFLVRHLVLPGGIGGTESIVAFLARELSVDTYLNLMAQYRPSGRVRGDTFPEMNRRITHDEYGEAVRAAKAAGLHRFD
jgi:putative pyruvate formate lyase activating enzyme